LLHLDSVQMKKKKNGRASAKPILKKDRSIDSDDDNNIGLPLDNVSKSDTTSPRQVTSFADNLNGGVVSPREAADQQSEGEGAVESGIRSPTTSSDQSTMQSIGNGCSNNHHLRHRHPSPHSHDTEAMHALEDRIHDLETKLAVLSRLLHFNTVGASMSSMRTSSIGSTNHRSTSDSVSPTHNHALRVPTTPPLPVSMARDRTPSIPPLESPAPTVYNNKHLSGSPNGGHSYQQQQQHHHSVNDNTRMPTLKEALTPLHHKPVASPAHVPLMDIFNPEQPTPKSDNKSIDIPSLAVDGSGAQVSQLDLPDNIDEGLHHRKKRNLSFRLLYGEDEAQYAREKLTSTAPPTMSMTAEERRWLQPLILQFQQSTGSASASFSLPPEPKAIVTKEQSESSHAYTDSPQQKSSEDGIRSKWLNYLNSFQETGSDVDEQMAEFIKVPAQMEVLMMYGFLVCVDSYLYMVTVLPIRFVWSCLLLLRRLVWWRRPPTQYQFHRQHMYQLIQTAILFIIYRFVLYGISIGKLYHWIRGQAMIKLYVVLAMVEVFDRLMCGLGQDCLESLYWNTVNRPRSMRMLTSITLVLIYATCHTLILFLHAQTLSVAMNSADHALLSLLISGNFAEIKSTVFKKYNKAALFKITASDICERFKLGLFLGLVLLVDMCQGMDHGQITSFFRICSYIWGAELVADAIKHAFITKFNFLSSQVYSEYALILAGDFTGIGHEGFNLDHSHAVVKRLAFSQIPLVVCMIRMIQEAIKYACLNGYCKDATRVQMIGAGAGLWLLIVCLKLSLGRYLHHISMIKLQSAPEITLPPPGKKKKQ
jgi:Eukaryotic membrane protein family